MFDKEPITPDYVCRQVSEYFGHSIAQLKGKSRKLEIVASRHLVMYLCHELGYGYSHIGEAMGGRDHTTVIHAVRKIDGQAGYDKHLKKQIETLKNIVTR